jgi:hypothetical protein
MISLTRNSIGVLEEAQLSLVRNNRDNSFKERGNGGANPPKAAEPHGIESGYGVLRAESLLSALVHFIYQVHVDTTASGATGGPKST